MDLVPLFATVVSLSIFLLVIELVRRGRLKERYSLLWIFSAAVMLLFSVSRKLLHLAAASLGIFYPPSLIFLLASIFLIIINVHFSTVISELSEKTKTLTQEIALLKETLEGKNENREE